MVAHGVVVEGVDGLAQLEHHVVGDVHQIVDGAHAGGRQPFLHPGGGRSDLDVLDEREGETAAEVRVGDLDRGAPLDPGTRPRRGDVRRGQRSAGERRHLARHPEDGQRIRPVRGEVEHVDPVSEHVPERRPRRPGGVENQDPLVFGREAQLRFGTHHPAGHHAPDAGLLQLAEVSGPRVGEHRPLRGERDVLTGGHVGGAADDRLVLPALVDGDQPEAVRVRVGLHFEDPPDDHPVPVAARSLDVRDLEAGQGQPVGEGVDVLRERHHGLQPAERNAHFSLP